MIFYGLIKDKYYLYAFLIHSHTLLSYLVITIIIFLLCFIAKLILVCLLSVPTKSFASKQQEYPLSSKTFIRLVFTHVRSVSLNNKSQNHFWYKSKINMQSWSINWYFVTSICLLPNNILIIYKQLFMTFGIYKLCHGEIGLVHFVAKLCLSKLWKCIIHSFYILLILYNKLTWYTSDMI